MNSKLFVLKLPALCFLLLTACQGPGRGTKSIVVIAVDQLSTNDLDCNREPRADLKPRPSSPQNLSSGLEALCQSAYRFSHAYTTSVLSAPAVASLLTAQYPLAHGLHDNANFLSPQIETVAERAVQKGFDTTFFSGGAPLLRKSGLNQGFVLFEDALKIQSNGLHRAFKNSVALFKTRLKELGSGTPSFSIFYVPDLRFTNVATTNSLGEPRNFSFESQLEEFDDNLGDLIRFLKTENRWETTELIVVGLNGRPLGARKNQILPTNLHSENTQVALLWKHSAKTSAAPTTINTPVSLADIGATLYALIDSENFDASNISEISELPVLPLAQLLEASHQPDSRWLATESGWAAWRLGQPLQVALRKSQILCLNEGTTEGASRCFNTMTDKEEVFDLPQSDPNLREVRSQQIEIFHKLNIHSVSTGQLRRPQLAALNPKLNPCYQVISKGVFDNTEAKRCDHPLSLDLLHWLAAEQNALVDPQKREQIRLRFLRGLSFEVIDRKVAQTQNQIDWIWDVPQNLMVEKSLLEHIFEIPELAKIRAQAYRALSQTRSE